MRKTTPFPDIAPPWEFLLTPVCIEVTLITVQTEVMYVLNRGNRAADILLALNDSLAVIKFMTD